MNPFRNYASDFVIVAVLLVQYIYAANKEPTDSKKPKQHIDPSMHYVEPLYPAVEQVPLSLISNSVANEHTVIPIAQDVAHSQDQKILENFIMPHLDPWEPVPRLPDHEVMVGTPAFGSNLNSPQMHMRTDPGGIATGVSDVLVDAIGTPIFQTFFGNRNAYLDDDDWSDEYDEEDSDEKRKQEDDDDDDDDDDDRLKRLQKLLLRSKMAPLIAASYRQRVTRRPAALIHKPLLLPKPAVGIPLRATSSAARPATHQRLVIPQLLPTGRVSVAGSSMSGYRIASLSRSNSPATNPRHAAVQFRTLRILYD